MAAVMIHTALNRTDILCLRTAWLCCEVRRSLQFVFGSVYRVTTHLEKSGNSKVVRENGKSQGSFASSKYSKTRFRLGLCPRPRWGSLQRSPDSLVGWRRGHPIPLLLQPELLNNRLSGLTLFLADRTATQYDRLLA